MIKRSFSVIMLALIAAPTYAVFGEQDNLPKAPKGMVNFVEGVVDGARDLKDKVVDVVTGQKVEAPKNNVIDAANNSLNNHVEEKKDDSPSQGSGLSSSNEEDKDKTSNENKDSEVNKIPANNNENKNSEEEVKPGFFSRCKNKAVSGVVSSKNAVVAGVSAFGAGIYAAVSKVGNAGLATGKFAVATMDPRTYWNAGKAVFKGQEGVSRFTIIKGHKEAVTGIVAATLASVGYVYREEIVDYSKKAYNWTANQVQSLRNYIQG
jgi:hypothetical protein